MLCYELAKAYCRKKRMSFDERLKIMSFIYLIRQEETFSERLTKTFSDLRAVPESEIKYRQKLWDIAEQMIQLDSSYF